MSKYSIIVVAANGIENTVKCLESVIQFTKDYELIVVNNNTNDGTLSYLEGKALQLGDKFKLIDSKDNLTFAENNNLGIGLATGEYIVFLNNDTIVCKDWCERMEQHFIHSPIHNIGAVGPVCNMSNGRQMVGIQDPEVWHQQHYGRWAHTGILYGWCIMVKKHIIDQIGGFDERFTNSYEDNDLCLRIQLAGYNLLIAYDTYIFHLGQGTFRQVMDIKQYIKNGEENKQRYYDKWHDNKEKKLVAVYRTNGGVWLEKSLEQTSKFADSIILHFCRARNNVDEARLQNILKSYPKVIKYEFYDGIFQEDYERGWLLDEALKLQAQGQADWCISIDDDEIYEDKFITRAKKMMTPRNPEIFAYWCNWRTIWDTRLGKEYYRTDSTFGSFSNYRFFRLIQGQKIMSKHPEGHHCGSAPWFADENLRWCNVRVKHMGYDTPEQRQRKYEFYEANDNFKNKADIGYDDYSHLISLNPQLEEYTEDNGISLICMVKNEEETLEGMLENVEFLVDEMIIVDTGSKDRTIEIIRKFKATTHIPVYLYHLPWADNYSLPRNFAKSKATQRWILMMDADERFRPENLHIISKHTETACDVVMFNVVNYLEKPKPSTEKTLAAPTQAARLFKNIPELYYTGIIHETPDDAIVAMRRKKRVASGLSPAVLYHYGYLKGKDKVRSKLDYYEMLNMKQIDCTDGQDPRPYYNLALHYMNDSKMDEALKSFQTCLEIDPNFYHASKEMAMLNINSAKKFLDNAIKTMPENHPAKHDFNKILNFLHENCRGAVKVD